MRNRPRGQCWPSALILTALVMAGTACSGSKVTTQTSAELSRYQIRTIALVPFTTLATPQVREAADTYLSTPQSVRRSDISLGVPPSVEAPLKQTATVPMHAAEKMTQLFWNRLKSRQGLTVISPSETAKAVLQLKSGETEPTTPEREAAALARALKADAALMGQVLVYQERSGGRFGANPPATVGFEVKAVASDGQLLWISNYYERQQPMTQDVVGYVQHGGVFVTAAELAEYGTGKVLKTFPFGRNEGE